MKPRCTAFSGPCGSQNALHQNSLKPAAPCEKWAPGLLALPLCLSHLLPVVFLPLHPPQIFSERESLLVPLTFNAKIPNSDLKNLMTRLAGTNIPPMDAKAMRFILIALFTQYAQPKEDILAKARSLGNVDSLNPTILAHVRRSDKKKEIRECIIISLCGPTFGICCHCVRGRL